MSFFRVCASVLFFWFLAQHTVISLSVPPATGPPDIGPPSIRPECDVKLRFVGQEVPNGEDGQTKLVSSLCECARWCKSIGEDYVHVLYIADEKQCYCERGIARRGEKRSDSLYYLLEDGPPVETVV